MEAAVFDHSEDSGLSLQGQMAYLVKKEGAAVSRLETAWTPLSGAGEGAGLVAEKLGVQQAWGEGGAIEGDVRASPAWA